MLSNAYFLAKFRFHTAENEPAKNLQILKKMLIFLVIQKVILLILIILLLCEARSPARAQQDLQDWAGVVENEQSAVQAAREEEAYGRTNVIPSGGHPNYPMSKSPKTIGAGVRNISARVGI